MTPEEGKAKALEIVNYYGAPMARFWLPTMDVVVQQMNDRAASDNGMTDSDDSLVAELFNGDWKTAHSSDDDNNATVIGNLLGVDPSDLIDVWNQQRVLWEAGKQPDRPSPAILKLAGIGKAPSDDKGFAKVAAKTVETGKTPAGKAVSTPKPPPGPVEHAAPASSGTAKVLGIGALLFGIGAVALKGGGMTRNPGRSRRGGRSDPWR